MREETGWKLVYGDVFRPPPYATLLSVYAGPFTRPTSPSSPSALVRKGKTVCCGLGVAFQGVFSVGCFRESMVDAGLRRRLPPPSLCVPPLCLCLCVSLSLFQSLSLSLLFLSFFISVCMYVCLSLPLSRSRSRSLALSLPCSLSPSLFSLSDSGALQCKAREVKELLMALRQGRGARC